MSEAHNAALDRVAAAFAEALGYQVSDSPVRDWRPPANAQGALVELSGAVSGTLAVVLDANEIAKYGDQGRQAASSALEAAAASIPGVTVTASGESEIPMLSSARALSEDGSVAAVVGWAATTPEPAFAPAAAAPSASQPPAPTAPPAAAPSGTPAANLLGGGFDTSAALLANMRLLHDVRMRVTAELGRAEMSVRELLELVPGSVIELDRIAGSPIDVLVNNKLVAKGEVVVIDEEFGVRITEILAIEEA